MIGNEKNSYYEQGLETKKAIEMPSIVVNEQYPLTLLYADEYAVIAFFRDSQGNYWTFEKDSNSLRPTTEADANFNPTASGVPADWNGERKFISLIEAALYLKYVYYKALLQDFPPLEANSAEEDQDNDKITGAERQLIISFISKYDQMLLSSGANRNKTAGECASFVQELDKTVGPKTLF